MFKLNSPRSLKACNFEGILLSSIKYRTIDSFAAPGKPLEIQKMEYNQYNSKRNSSLQLILELIFEAKEARMAIIKKQNKQINKKDKNTSNNYISETPNDETIIDPNNNPSNTKSEKEKLPQIQFYYELLRRVLHILSCSNLNPAKKREIKKILESISH